MAETAFPINQSGLTRRNGHMIENTSEGEVIESLLQDL